MQLDLDKIMHHVIHDDIFEERFKHSNILHVIHEQKTTVMSTRLTTISYLVVRHVSTWLLFLFMYHIHNNIYLD